MNNAAKAKVLATEVTRKAAEPGLLTAFAAIGVMLSVTAILVLMIYGLMLAIRPIEKRQPSLGASKPIPALGVGDETVKRACVACAMLSEVTPSGAVLTTRSVESAA